MKVTVTRITSWADVLNAARFTQRKESSSKEPSDKFKRQIVRAEHSPLRCLMFNIDFYDIPYYVSVHLCRHIHAQPFVSTSRPDVLKDNPSRKDQRKSDPVNMRLFLNAQEIINISKVRLCNKAEFSTRIIWKEAIDELRKIEPILANACVPSCIYRSQCPEISPCGFTITKEFSESKNNYLKALSTT